MRRRVRLDALCDIRSGGTPPRSTNVNYDGSIPWAKIDDLNVENGTVSSTKECISEIGLQSIRGRLFEPGTLLFAMYGSVGKMAWAGVRLATNQAILGISVLEPQKLAPSYLKHWLASKQADFDRDANGVTQKNLSAGYIKALEIELPSIAEQLRIAAILDKADNLRRKRQEAIRLADEFLKATFIELFGDPVTNSRNWPTQSLESLGTLDRGVSKHRPRNDPRLLGGDYPLIQTGDVANCDGYVRTFTSTYSELGLRQSKLWPAGTLCITIAANIAKTGILLFPACFPDSVVGFSAPDRPTVEYVRFWLSFLQQTLEANAPASAQKNINLAILRELQIPVPSRDRVERFAAAVDKVEAIRQAQRLAVDESQKLHRALEHALLTP